MKLGSTTFLKLAVFLLGIPALILYGVGLPYLIKNPANPDYGHILYPIVIVIFISTVPYIAALVQAFKLLSYIDQNIAFSERSVKALKNIKYCAVTIVGLYVIGLPFIFMVAELDDAPGLGVIGMLLIFAPLVIAVFAAVLQKLLQEAIHIKSENDLTV
ncbi:DUF2975 domain-containing protein [Chungangia koreensis]|uniref:DUF2975 domain-containing protein n=1 Tax=Chungangia koreensis TaxID=752657 RepID=A0ABV8X4J8_9LACT